MNMHSDLIIHLIQQDLRHIQLIRHVEKNGKAFEDPYLEIMSTVGEMMGIPPKQMSDLFVEVYMKFMEMGERVPVDTNTDELKGIAGRCYEMLKCCVEVNGL